MTDFVQLSKGRAKTGEHRLEGNRMEFQIRKAFLSLRAVRKRIESIHR